MSSHVRIGDGSNLVSALRGTFAAPLFALSLLAALPACSSDDKNTGGTGSGTAAFEQCVSELTPVCKVAEFKTPEQMETSCAATEFLPVPLTDGSTYGPITTKAGPYGAKTMWNQGAGTDFVNPVNPSEPQCLPTLIDAFQEPSATTDDLKNTRGLDYSLYTIFRPACMKDGETYPVITWANGTCGLTHGYALLLGGVASHGFVVIASNSTWTATPPTNTVQARAIDYAEALNEDETSVLYHHLDLDKVGAMGHSQGAQATVSVASDPRVKSIIAWNQGVSTVKPFLNVSGDRDIGGGSVDLLKTGTEAASQPGAWLYFHKVLQTGGAFTGHLVLMEQPERVWKLAVDWWQWQLNGDSEAEKSFKGDGCGLCNSPDDYDFGVNENL